ncbi:anti-virulence regulator CigR family protein [Halomonas salifodinae]|uniref:anti-virulence regulator CigR family protein n=1 Tax=Halomonas salifodinae TaxID=438745 RepID=UPI0033BE2743
MKRTLVNCTLLGLGGLLLAAGPALAQPANPGQGRGGPPEFVQERGGATAERRGSGDDAQWSRERERDRNRWERGDDGREWRSRDRDRDGWSRDRDRRDWDRDDRREWQSRDRDRRDWDRDRRDDREWRRDRDRDRWVGDRRSGPRIEERLIREIFRDHRELWRHDRGAALPPGIRMNLERGKPLPPGIARRFDDRLYRQLPRYEGYEWRRVGADVVLVEMASDIVYEVLRDIFID